jgi:hypothetical protein
MIMKPKISSSSSSSFSACWTKPRQKALVQEEKKEEIKIQESKGGNNCAKKG